MNRASNLSEDLEDEEFTEIENGNDLAIKKDKVGRNRSKKSYDKTKVRRSNQIRIKSRKS